MRRCTICKTVKSYYHFGPFGSDTFRWCLDCIAQERNITEKHCSCCEEVKGIDNFGPQPRARDGRKSHCKQCNAQVQQRRRNKDPKRESNYNKTPPGRYRHYTWGAKRRHIPFDLTLDQFKLFWQQPCSYCGIKIETIGLDRKNSARGYTFKNVVPCCFECNTQKSDMPLKEWNKWRHRIAEVIMREQRAKCG